ncbi:hypothetical protein [Clostridium sp. BJN0013]|uniref:hypothetical protein n=1 Tax=Clostridium sp. BJN0013 TaxID=3236840 RepID=UPI0034C61EF5
MLMTEFYRQAIAKVENEIKAAELERNFKKVAKLQAERAKWEERARREEKNA